MERTYQQIPQKHNNSNLPNRRDINRGFILNLGTKVLVTRKVNTHSTAPQQAGIKLVRVTGHASNHHITQRCSVLDRPASHILNLVPTLLKPFATRKPLHTRDIDAVDARAVVGQESRKRPTDDLGPVDDADGVAVQPVAVGQDSVIDLQVLQDFDNGEWRARQDGFLRLRGPFVQKPDILVHVEHVPVAQPLDVLGYVHDLLQVLVLSVVEDGVVYDDSVDVRVGVGGEDGFFDVVF